MPVNESLAVTGVPLSFMVQPNIKLAPPGTQLDFTAPAVNTGGYLSFDNFMGQQITPQTEAAIKAHAHTYYEAQLALDQPITITVGSPNMVTWGYGTPNYLYTYTNTVWDQSPCVAGTWTNTMTWGNTGTYTIIGPVNAYLDGQAIMITTGADNIVSFVGPDKNIIAKNIIKSNLLISRGRSRSYDKTLSPQEIKARNTLRDMLSESEWRRYLTNGFIMARGQSGKWYQIFKSQSPTKVYEKNKCIGDICIHTDSKCPPTDHIINLKLLAEFDEEAIWTGGRVSNYVPDLKKNKKLKSQLIAGLAGLSPQKEPLLLSSYKAFKNGVIGPTTNLSYNLAV